MTRKSIDVVTWLKNWFESKTNKVTSLSSNSTDTEYPTAKAVYDALQDAGGCVQDYYYDNNTNEIVIEYVCGSGATGATSIDIADLNDVTTVTVTVTYTDDTTENIQLLKYTGS